MVWMFLTRVDSSCSFSAFASYDASSFDVFTSSAFRFMWRVARFSIGRRIRPPATGGEILGTMSGSGPSRAASTHSSSRRSWPTKWT